MSADTNSEDDKSKLEGRKRSNETHSSKTDPAARLLRKGKGQESILCHPAHVLVDSVSGIVKACRVTKACGLGGNPEVLAALEMAEVHMSEGGTMIADRGYDQRSFVSGLRELGIRAHPQAKSVGSTIDGRTTNKPCYEASMKRRYIVEPVFRWIKGPGRMRQTMLKGTAKVSWQFYLYAMAYNLVRMARAA